jgi:hypothetical protein
VPPIFLTFEQLFGRAGGVVAGVTLTAIALLLLYGLGFALRKKRDMSKQDLQTSTSLKSKPDAMERGRCHQENDRQRYRTEADAVDIFEGRRQFAESLGKNSDQLKAEQGLRPGDDDAGLGQRTGRAGRCRFTCRPAGSLAGLSVLAACPHGSEMVAW